MEKVKAQFPIFTAIGSTSGSLSAMFYFLVEDGLVLCQDYGICCVCRLKISAQQTQLTTSQEEPNLILFAYSYVISAGNFPFCVILICRYQSDQHWYVIFVSLGC